MDIFQKELTIVGTKKGPKLISSLLEGALNDSRMKDGVCQVFCMHTSASLTINENSDARVCKDLETAFSKLAPENYEWEHADEGPDDMPAHIKTALTGNSLSIPFSSGKFKLGVWQGVFLWEHRTSVPDRRLFLTFLGSK